MRNKPVSNISQLRFKLAEKFAALENGEITVSDAKAFAGLAGAIINTVKVEMVQNATIGATKEIDFLSEMIKPIPVQTAVPNTPPAKSKLKEEFLEERGKVKFFKPDRQSLASYFMELRIDNNRAIEETDKFLDYFDSNGWVVGKSMAPMRDWKAAARGWVYRMNEYRPQQTATSLYPTVGAKVGTSEARMKMARDW